MQKLTGLSSPSLDPSTNKYDPRFITKLRDNYRYLPIYRNPLSQLTFFFFLINVKHLLFFFWNEEKLT